MSIEEIRRAWGTKIDPKMHYPDWHAVMEAFPSPSAGKIDGLIEDIRRKGMRRPIALYQGKVIDGRARIIAAQRLKIQPGYLIVRRRDPVLFLIERATDQRFGVPSSPERQEALQHLRAFDTGREAARQERKQWLSHARREFRDAVSTPQPCAVCKRHLEFVHAHHSLPLNVQYDLGLFFADHTHDWLCPTHHRIVHTFVSIYMLGSREGEILDCIPDHLAPEWGGAEAVYARGHQLFKAYGGQEHFHARWHDEDAFR